MNSRFTEELIRLIDVDHQPDAPVRGKTADFYLAVDHQVKIGWRHLLVIDDDVALVILHE